MKKFIIYKILLLFIILSLTLPHQALGHKSAEGKEASSAQDDTAIVLRVIDGDTIKVKYRGQKESIRLIGIDAPESRINKKALKDAQRSGQDIKAIISQGKQATKYVKSLIKPGDTINLEFDVQPRDRYGRLLDYVYLGDGKMLNEEILKAGYAGLMTIPPNVKYGERFREIHREAREQKRGLWGEN